jgi:hypothetical protein
VERKGDHEQPFGAVCSFSSTALLTIPASLHFNRLLLPLPWKYANLHISVAGKE